MKISKNTQDLLEQLWESMIQDLELDDEIIRDCFPLEKPFRQKAFEALLTVETRMKKRLNLPPSDVGMAVIEAAARMNVFKRNVLAEEQGIQLLFKGSVLGLRNVLGHNKLEMNKQEAMKIILFADYLIKLFELQCKKNKVKRLKQAIP